MLKAEAGSSETVVEAVATAGCCGCAGTGTGNGSRAVAPPSKVEVRSWALAPANERRLSAATCSSESSLSPETMFEGDASNSSSSSSLMSSKCEAGGRLDLLGWDREEWVGRGGFFTAVGFDNGFRVFLAARYHLTPQALQRVFGPSGPSRH